MSCGDFMNRFGWVVPATVILLGTALQSAYGQAVDRTKDETPPETTADAVVTFYGSGDLWKSYVPGTKTTLFQGCIFDGEEKVGCLTFLGFLSVRLSPGVHIFSASLHDNHSVANSQMPVLLEAGKNYYLRAIQEQTPKTNAKDAERESAAMNGAPGLEVGARGSACSRRRRRSGSARRRRGRRRAGLLPCRRRR